MGPVSSISRRPFACGNLGPVGLTPAGAMARRLAVGIGEERTVDMGMAKGENSDEDEDEKQEYPWEFGEAEGFDGNL